MREENTIPNNLVLIMNLKDAENYTIAILAGGVVISKENYRAVWEPRNTIIFPNESRLQSIHKFSLGKYTIQNPKPEMLYYLDAMGRVRMLK